MFDNFTPDALVRLVNYRFENFWVQNKGIDEFLLHELVRDPEFKNAAAVFVRNLGLQDRHLQIATTRSQNERGVFSTNEAILLGDLPALAKIRDERGVDVRKMIFDAIADQNPHISDPLRFAELFFKTALLFHDDAKINDVSDITVQSKLNSHVGITRGSSFAYTNWHGVRESKPVLEAFEYLIAELGRLRALDIEVQSATDWSSMGYYHLNGALGTAGLASLELKPGRASLALLVQVQARMAAVYKAASSEKYRDVVQAEVLASIRRTRPLLWAKFMTVRFEQLLWLDSFRIVEMHRDAASKVFELRSWIAERLASQN